MSLVSTKQESLAKPEDDIIFLFDTNFFNMKNFQKGKTVTHKADSGEETKYDFVIEGMANVKIVDRIGDRIRPEAFEEDMHSWNLNPVLRFNHDEGSLIGHCTDTEIRENGLWIRAAIGDWKTPNGVDCKEIKKMIEFGSLKTLSVMGRIKEFEEIEKEDPDGNLEYIWDVKRFDLVEISIVEIPMNYLSIFEKKGLSREMAIKEALNKVANELKKKYLKQVSDKEKIKRKVNTMSETITKKKTKKKSKRKSKKSDDVEITKDEVIPAVVTEEVIAKQDDEDEAQPEEGNESEEENQSEEETQDEEKEETQDEEETEDQPSETNDDELMKQLDLITDFVQNVDSKLNDFSTSLTDIDSRLKKLEQPENDNENNEGEEESEDSEEKSLALPTRTITSVEIQKSVLVDSLTPVIKNIVTDLVSKELESVKKEFKNTPKQDIKSKLTAPGSSKSKKPVPTDMVSVISGALKELVVGQ